jgi:hypothetical protein
MDKQPNPLTRVCTSCGVKKPLSAFLYVSGAQGTTYGTICSDCRRTVTQPNKNAPKESDEHSTSSSGLRIGSQQKIATTIEKRRQHKDLSESYEQEAKDRDQLKEEHVEREETKEKAEKDHRKFFIDVKKQGFLGKKTIADTKQTTTIQRINTIRDRETTEASNQQSENRTVENRKVEANAEDEISALAVALTGTQVDPQHAEVRSTLALKVGGWFRSGKPISNASIKTSMEHTHKTISEQKTNFLDKELQKKRLQEKQEPVLEQANKLPSKHGR